MPVLLRWRYGVFVLVGLIAPAIEPSGAHAQAAATLRYRVDGDARGCISEAKLRARVGRFRVEGAAGDDLIVELDAAREAPVLRVLRGDAVIAVRDFDVLPAACADRVAAIALVIAVTLEHAGARPERRGEVDDDEAGATSAEPPAAQPEASPSEAAPARPEAQDMRERDAEEDATEEDEEDAADARDAESTDARWLVHAGGGVALGAVPEPTWLAGVGLGLELAALRFGFSGLLSGADTQALGSGRVRERFFGAAAHACLGQRFNTLDGEACAGALAGLVLAEGRGFEAERDTAMALIAPLARVALRWPARSTLAVRVSLVGFFPVIRPAPSFVDAQGEISKRSGAVAGALGSLEIVVRLP